MNQTDTNVKINNQAQRMSTKTMVLTGMCAAVTAILSQIAIPLPSGVPVTLQTFAVALAGYMLGWKSGGMSTAVYILMGCVGVPVFSNFSGGLGIIAGKTGGFITGFLFMSMLCGIGARQKGKFSGIAFGLAGLLIVHAAGVIQFSVLTGMKPLQATALVSLPYIGKDIASVAAAYFAGRKIRRHIGNSEGMEESILL